MQQLSDKIEVEARGVQRTHSPLIDSIFYTGENQVTKKSIARICSVEGCTARLKCRGVCRGHYYHLRTFGEIRPYTRSSKLRPRYCSVDGCERKHQTNGFCSTHASRFRSHGDPLKTLTDFGVGETRVARFWSKVVVTANPDKCWEWQGSRDALGYGHTSFHSKATNAHRLSWFLVHGVWPATLLRHKCDNPPCVNPNHLEEGTMADNCRDRDERGRGAKGEKAGRAKISEADVIEIRRIYKRRSRQFGTGALARRYGLSVSAMGSIVRRVSWRHI
jgi:hypothetical protein